MRKSLVFATLLIPFAAHADEPTAAVRKQIVDLTQQLMDGVGEGKSDVWQRDAARRRADHRRIRPPPDQEGSRRKHSSVSGGHIGQHRSARSARARIWQYGGDRFRGLRKGNFFRTAFRRALYRDGDVHAPRRRLESRDDARRHITDGSAEARCARHSSSPITPARIALRRTARGSLKSTTENCNGAPKRDVRRMALDAIAKDVFMGGDDEKNLMIFRRDESGQVVELIERRKFNDLRLKRE